MSRGLGDVYKRQIPYEPEIVELEDIEVIDADEQLDGGDGPMNENESSENNQIELDF